jgi:hypothetical protein
MVVLIARVCPGVIRVAVIRGILNRIFPKDHRLTAVDTVAPIEQKDIRFRVA